MLTLTPQKFTATLQTSQGALVFGATPALALALAPALIGPTGPTPIITDKTTHADVFADFVVSGLLSPTSANLTSTLAAGVAYVLGQRVVKLAEPFTYAASMDTYDDMGATGVITRVVVANLAAAPTVTANTLRLQMVRTAAAAVTLVTRIAALRLFSVAANGTMQVAGAPGAGSLIALSLVHGDPLVTNTIDFRMYPRGFHAYGGILSYGETSAGAGLAFYTGTSGVSTEKMRIATNGAVGIGQTVPTAFLHLKPGTAALNTAPIKFTSGPRNTAPVAGQIQYDNAWWMTDSAAVDRRIESTNFTALPFSITPPASAAAYQNATGYPLDVLITGGTVSSVEFSRDGTNWFVVGYTAGMVPLSPLDRVRVTYSAAPTMTGIPR